MKIQDLGIIFIVIILPISLILSIYTQFQIETLNLQTEYDSKLISATYDAIKAFQLNTANSTMSDISNSKIRDIEASANTFKKSLMSTFGLNGYTEEELNSYIPALVYTMYDGFYVYAPFDNTNYLYDSTTGEPINDNEKVIYGLRPYISYSARYKKGTDIDVVITYSLDNYIVIQGTINGTYINDEGYLIDDIEIIGDINEESCIVKYEGIEIEKENELTEYVGNQLYPYIKINGTKYYYDSSNQEIFYMMNGKKTTQYKGLEAQNFYMRKINKNASAKEYYKKAYVFTDKIRNVYNLDNLTFSDAYINVIKSDGTIENKQLFEGDTRKIFAKETGTNAKNIENKTSNFNQHRLEVIRQSIEQNLSVVIANYNKYSGTAGTGVEFQMPKLKEDEWDLILNNISLISFVQGLNIGGKTYNGYTIVNNTETKELIREEDIYIIGNDNSYHKIGDNYLNDETNILTSIPAGRLSLDFKRSSLIETTGTGDVLSYFYPRKEDASYNSIITKNDFTTYEDIYIYVQENANDLLKKVFYTALGREREGQYKSTISNDELFEVEFNKIVLNYETDGAENKDLFTIQESLDGRFIINPSIPTKPNNNFLGWTTNPVSNIVEYAPNDSIELSQSKTLYAVWALKEYKIFYKFNGAPGVEPPPSIKLHDQPIQIKCEVPDWEGHTFLGWSLSSTSTTVDYNQNDIYNQNADITLYAVWTGTQYTVRYDANGGISAPDSQIKQHGINIILASTIRQRVDYDFIGWSENPNAITPEYLPGSIYSENRDITLYAIWKKKTFTIKYDANGGSGAPAAQTKEYGATITLSGTKPTRNGYTFVGWSTNKNATTASYNPGQNYSENKNITLYAVWKANKVTAVDLINWYGWKGENWVANVNSAGEATSWPTDILSHGIVLYRAAYDVGYNAGGKVSQTITYKEGHKYWIYAAGKVIWEGRLEFNYGLGVENLNDNNKVNKVVTAGRTFQATISAQMMQDTGDNTARFYYCNIVDLTETFGAGNEKDAAWCAANLGGFNGSKQVNR